MPLPPNGQAWPPASLAVITPALQQWSAWWVGDPSGLESAYGRNTGLTARPSQYAGGVQGALARFFWGRPRTDLTSVAPGKVHVPIASDLCQASADLLFSEAPTFTVTNEATQARLDKLVDDGMISTLAETAEIAAALGGAFLRVTWDAALADAPFLTTVHADAAVPEFRWGRLVAATFWHTVKADGQQVWRHLERHELDSGGNGIILHGLYQGTIANLGRVVPLTDDPSTAGLPVDDQSSINTGPGLAVVYIPNQRPQRRWRTDPLGSNLGRSDLDGVEGLMDALDETYSSWMRDIRLGKARILAAASLLQDNGPGRGASFDADREVFTPLTILQSGDSTGLPIEAVQFQIRVAEHQQTAQQLLEDILRTAGYSAQTFGEAQADASITATEVSARQQRSLMTRGRKIRAWRPALSQVLEKLLAVDVAVFGTRVLVERPDVTFVDGVQESTLSLAQTAQTLATAQAASTDTLVRLIHPDWDDEAVQAEVDAVSAQYALPSLPDPTSGAVGAAGDLAPDALALMVQKIYLGVGTVLTSDEARAIINDAGGHLTGPGPQPTPGA